MGIPQNPSPPHLYPHELQLKLYQAFIFSIPILFSIILFLLFYLFYLKRRASSLSSPPPILPRTLNHATSFTPLASEMGLKGEVKDKLTVVLADEDLRAKDSQCCVCLGEFEMKEELHQVPSCKHVFHVDCIGHWLQSNSTCPLCRGSIDVAAAAATKLGHDPQPPPLINGLDSQRLEGLPSEQQQQQQQPQDNFGSDLTNHSIREPPLMLMQGSSSTISACSREQQPNELMGHS